MRKVLALFVLLSLTGCCSKYGFTRHLDQQSHLGGTVAGVCYGSPKGARWNEPSRPVPNVIINTDHPPEWYVPGY